MDITTRNHSPIGDTNREIDRLRVKLDRSILARGTGIQAQFQLQELDRLLAQRAKMAK